MTPKACVCIFITAVLASCGNERLIAHYDPTVEVDGPSLVVTDFEKRYEIEPGRSSLGGTYVTLKYKNICPETHDEYRLIDAAGASFGAPCNLAAKGEVLILPDNAHVVIGTTETIEHDNAVYSIGTASPDRVLVLKVEPNTYQLRTGHPRVYRTDIYGLVVEPSDSLVIHVKKTFLPSMECESLMAPPGSAPAANNPFVRYLLRNPNDLYFRARGVTMLSCNVDLYHYLAELPEEYR